MTTVDIDVEAVVRELVPALGIIVDLETDL